MIGRYGSFSGSALAVTHPAPKKHASWPDLSLPDSGKQRVLRSVGNLPSSATPRASTDSLEAGRDLRGKTPSPGTSTLLLDCRDLAMAPHASVTVSPAGRLETIPEGSAEHLLRRHHGLDEPQARVLAEALRRGGFQPPKDRIWSAGDVSIALRRLSERQDMSALPPRVCEQTAVSLQNALQDNRPGRDPWHQFDADFRRNPYFLNGSRQRSLEAFRAASVGLTDTQRRFVCEAHQGLLAEVEVNMFAGSALHRDGALLRSHDGSTRSGPEPDTRYHVNIVRGSPEHAVVSLLVEHDRPLSAAAPRTAGLDVLPERRVLTEDSMLRIRLKATCSPTGEITVKGEHSINLRYPETSRHALERWVPAALPIGGDTDHVRDRLTATLMELHAASTSSAPLAVAHQLLTRGQEDEKPGITSLLDLALALDLLVGKGSVLPADLARFAFDELRRCAEQARRTSDVTLLAQLQQAAIPAGADDPMLIERLPDHGHWANARQALCGLIAALFYRNADDSSTLQLDSLSTSSDRAVRKARVARLEDIARTSNWPALGALLPRRRLTFSGVLWDTTVAQRPAPCAFHHRSASRYLETALGCLNAIRHAQAQAQPDGS